MKNLKRLFTVVFFISILAGGTVHAEDTDLFMINKAASSQLPNILIVFDNTSNWSKYFVNERAALVSLLSSNIVNERFNLGFMFFNNPNNKNGFNNAESGVVVAAVRNMNDYNKAYYRQLFEGLDINGDQGSSSPTYAGAMAEAWRYFSGGLATDGGMNDTQRDYLGNTSSPKAYFNGVHALPKNALLGLTERAYQSPVVDICQKNYIIFISNGTPSSSEKNQPYDLAAQSGSSVTPGSIGLPNSFFQDNYADEWTGFMATHRLPNKPNVFTYTISVDAANWPQHPADAEDLLRSMAKQGGTNKYIPITNNAQVLLDELDKIFQEIAAVNSVFASVTLPVNVNQTGQSLNQIYMGVFRPDAGASPRWPGNLKLYKIESRGGTPVMVGQNCTGDPATGSQVCGAVYDGANGFVSNTAQSFWTSILTNVTQMTAPNTYQFGLAKFWTTSYYPEAQGSGVPPRDGEADLPDGEMVEKGGAAQRLRGAYSYDATTSPGQARVPDRNLYTYTCTAATGECKNDSLSTMPFSTGNASLAGSNSNTVFGLGGAAPVLSLVRGGSSCSTVSCISRVVATTDGNHPFTAGTSVTISGAANNAFNGSVKIQTVPDATSFTFDVVESPVPVASGSAMKVALAGAGTIAVSALSYSDAGTLRTVRLTATGHALTVGAQLSVIISGITPVTYYSGSKTVSVVDANTLTYVVGQEAMESPPPGTTTFSAPLPSAEFFTLVSCQATTAKPTAGSRPISSVARSLGSNTVTVTPTTLTPDVNGIASVRLTGTAYDGCYTCSAPGCQKKKSDFTVTATTVQPITPSLSGASIALSTQEQAIVSLTRGPSTCGTGTAPCTASVTVKVTDPSVYAAKTVQVSGTGVFDGNYPVTGTDNTAKTFTYSIVTQPPHQETAATGTINAVVSTGGLTATNLINWIRGQNLRDEDNPSRLSEDVRGYLHGDVLHSRPAIINYNRATEPADRDLVVFYGANDGILHALKGGKDATDGAELWGFIAPEHFNRFQRMYANAPLWSETASRPYFFDGPISTLLKPVVDTTNGKLRIDSADPNAVARIFAGMRRGGRSYYAFDVTNPNDPKYLWRIQGGAGDFAELGYTWSEAKVAKMLLPNSTGTNVSTDVLIFGGGYDPVANDATPQGTATMGRSIFVVNANTGALIWRVGPTASSPIMGGAEMSCSIPADVVTLDGDGNGYIDRIYAVDTCGNVWRANVGDTDSSKWKVGKLFALSGNAATEERKFLFAPSLVREESYDILLLGSGDREKPFDLSVANRFYALRDYKGVNDLGGSSVEVTTTDADGIPKTETMDSPTVLDSQLCDFTSIGASEACLCAWTDKLTADQGWSDSSTTKRGWKIDFSSCPGEKVVSGAVTIAGTTVFSTNVPTSSSCSTTLKAKGLCSTNIGDARNYVISYQCGYPFKDQDGVAGITIADRFIVDLGGGYPPTGTPIQTTDDNGKPVTGTICIGPNCITVGPQISQRRHRVYWHMGIDNR